MWTGVFFFFFLLISMWWIWIAEQFWSIPSSCFWFQMSHLLLYCIYIQHIMCLFYLLQRHITKNSIDTKHWRNRITCMITYIHVINTAVSQKWILVWSRMLCVRYVSQEHPSEVRHHPTVPLALLVALHLRNILGNAHNLLLWRSEGII